MSTSCAGVTGGSGNSKFRAHPVLLHSLSVSSHPHSRGQPRRRGSRRSSQGPCVAAGRPTVSYPVARAAPGNCSVREEGALLGPHPTVVDTALPRHSVDVDPILNTHHGHRQMNQALSRGHQAGQWQIWCSSLGTSHTPGRGSQRTPLPPGRGQQRTLHQGGWPTLPR